MALGVRALVPTAAANPTRASGATPRVGERRGPASMARLTSARLLLMVLVL